MKIILRSALLLALSVAAWGAPCGALARNPRTHLLDCVGTAAAGTVTSIGLSGTANQITVTGASPITTAGSWTLSLPSLLTLPGDILGSATADFSTATSFKLPVGTAPTVNAIGQLAFDSNLWGASRGSWITYDGTAATALVGVLVSDTPTNGQTLKWNTGGTITWEDAASAGVTSLGGLTGVVGVASGIAVSGSNIVFDSSVLAGVYANLTITNTYTAGARQIHVPSSTTPGFNITPGSFASFSTGGGTPLVAGDFAIDNSGHAAYFNGTNMDALVKFAGSGAALSTAPTAGRMAFWAADYGLAQDADCAFATDTLTCTKLIGSTSITDTGLTAGRVTFAGTAGLLADDADFTFATDTATITKIAATTSLTVAGAFVTNNIPQNSQSADYTLVLGDAGKGIYHPGADTTARTWTIPANASVAYPLQTCVTFFNDTSGGVITVAITSDTLVLAGAGTTGSRSLAANGVATACKVTTTRWMISGNGLT